MNGIESPIISCWPVSMEYLKRLKYVLGIYSLYRMEKKEERSEEMIMFLEET
jgi:hypothetical protein